MSPWFEFILVFLAATSGSILGARAGYRRLEKRLGELEDRIEQLEAWVVGQEGRK
jgi:hypothetical protein